MQRKDWNTIGKVSAFGVVFMRILGLNIFGIVPFAGFCISLWKLQEVTGCQK